MMGGVLEFMIATSFFGFACLWFSVVKCVLETRWRYRTRSLEVQLQCPVGQLTALTVPPLIVSTLTKVDAKQSVCRQSSHVRLY